MPRTPTAFEQFAATHLKRPEGGAWATAAVSNCVEAVWYFGGFKRSFDNATVAANYVLQRYGLDPDWRTAVAGEFHYWGTGPGHITMESRLHPGNELMASSFANSLAPGLGYMPIGQYGVPVGHGHTYMGHSPYFGDETLAPEIDPSGGGATPVLPSSVQQEEETMTDLIYYAHGTASQPITGPDGKAGYVVTPESMWYQECPGAPLYPLTNNAPYLTGAYNLEWLAFAGARPNNTADLVVTPDQLASLLVLRGFAPKPSGNFFTSSPGSAPDLTPVLAKIAASDAANLANFKALGGAVTDNDNAILNGLKAVPTAAQNGAASRAAIVAPAVS